MTEPTPDEPDYDRVIRLTVAAFILIGGVGTTLYAITTATEDAWLPIVVWLFGAIIYFTLRDKQDS